MAKISEYAIVKKLKAKRWLHAAFKLKRVNTWKNVYVGPGQTKEADLVGIDYQNRIYAFEIKKEGNDIGIAFDQACAYCNGANFVYCILDEKSVSQASVDKLKKTGIGLLVYETRKSTIQKPSNKIKSIDHKGAFLEKTRSALPEATDEPRCYIFPFDTPRKTKRILHPDPKTKLVEYGYDAKRHLPQGSIIVFCSQNSLVGQGTIVKSRKTTIEDDGRESRLAIFWADSIYEYPNHVPLDDVKDQISALQGRKGRALTMIIRRYPRLSFDECQLVVKRAFEKVNLEAKKERHVDSI